MQMFKCEECDCLFEFDDAKKITESHGEIFMHCPDCKSPYFEEISPCEICGKYSAKMKDGFCEECINDVRGRFEALLEEFDEKEREILKFLEVGDLI